MWGNGTKEKRKGKRKEVHYFLVPVYVGKTESHSANLANQEVTNTKDVMNNAS
jgi:hypothetical protein